MPSRAAIDRTRPIRGVLGDVGEVDRQVRKALRQLGGVKPVSVPRVTRRVPATPGHHGERRLALGILARRGELAIHRQAVAVVHHYFTSETLRTTQEGQVTERFSKAIALMATGSDAKPGAEGTPRGTTRSA